MKHFNTTILALLFLGGIQSSAIYADNNTDVSTTTATVQKIDWSKYNKSLADVITTDANNPKKIYLYDIQQDKFVTVGGRYGAQPILAEMGMFFYIDKVGDSEKYYIHSWVDNKVTSSADEGTNGDYLGAKPKLEKDERHFADGDDNDEKKSIMIYIDRGKSNYENENTAISGPNRVQWAISPTTEGGYKLHSTWTDTDREDTERDYYLCYYQGPDTETPQKKFLAVTTIEANADRFYFIQEEDYHQAIASQDTKYINVSGLINDARFERNNKGITVNLVFDENGKPAEGYRDEFGNYNEGHQVGNVWQFRYNRNDDTYMYPGGQGNIWDLAYTTAQIGPKGNFDGGETGNYIIQKITGLQPGLYRINCQGFFFDPDLDPEGNGEQYQKENYSFIFASDNIDDVSTQTRLKNISHDDWEKMKNGTYNGAASTEDGCNGFTSVREKYMINAGKIFADNNPYEDKDVDSRCYDNSVAILVKADEGSTTGTLYIGAGKTNIYGAVGHVLVDNFQLFYMGDKQWYLDATNTETKEFELSETTDADGKHSVSGINHNPEGNDQYKYPVTYNLRRGFSIGKWESLILPCDLTGDQVKQAFGGDKDTKLSVYDKITDQCIYFRTVNPDEEGIKAGQFYIIQVNKEPDVKTKNDEYSFPWGTNKYVKVNGPIYQIQGVTPPTFTEDAPTVTYEGSKYNVSFKGFYYDPGYAPANSYVITKGNMYHLTSNWEKFVGTSWYITVTDKVTGEAKSISFSFDGNDETTAIKDITLTDDAKGKTYDGYIYNLAGQRVASKGETSLLKAGVYICNGKKIYIK